MRSLILTLSVILALTLPAAPVTASPAACTGLFISEYVEGSANNKAIEIFNGTGQAIDLAGHSLEFYFNGSTTPSVTIPLAGTLAQRRCLRRRRPRGCSRDSRRSRSNLRFQLLQRRRCGRPQARFNRPRRDRPGRVRPRQRVGQRLDHHTGSHAAPKSLGQHRRLQRQQHLRSRSRMGRLSGRHLCRPGQPCCNLHAARTLDQRARLGHARRGHGRVCRAVRRRRRQHTARRPGRGVLQRRRRPFLCRVRPGRPVHQRGRLFRAGQCQP